MSLIAERVYRPFLTAVRQPPSEAPAIQLSGGYPTFTVHVALPWRGPGREKCRSLGNHDYLP
jgi:hypothetical protein